MRLLTLTHSLLAVMACGCGVPSYDFGPADAARPVMDSSRDAGHPVDARTTHESGSEKDTGAPSKDAGVDAPCVTGSVEDCTNGIDDNCDGLVDCEDPECSGDAGAYSCTILPTKNGWSLVAYQAGSAACPPSFGTTPTPVYSNVVGDPDSCGCNCNNVTPATCTGAWAWMTAGATSCGIVPSSGGNPVANGACQNSNGVDNLATTDVFQGAPNGVRTVAGSCSATVAPTQTPLSKVTGETCAVLAVGGGCGVGAVCAPKVPSSFSRCSLSTSETKCPTGFDETDLVTGYSDTRGCSGCSCGTVDLGCNVTGMHFFANTGCTGGSYDMRTGCTQESGLPGGNSSSFQADLYTSASGTDCAVTSPSTPTGAVTTSGPEIVCCEAD
jgi:hypothetical protein